jgi:hypothetical protein
MQLTSTTGTMVVDYFPIEGDTQFIYKVLKFQGVDTMSTKCITKRDFEYECAERIGLGYNVTGFNTEAVNVNPMNGAT